MTLDEWNEEAAKVIGDLMQVPPMVSAIRETACRFTSLARKGIEVEREPRLVHIYITRFTEYAEPLGKFRVAAPRAPTSAARARSRQKLAAARI